MRGSWQSGGTGRARPTAGRTGDAPPAVDVVEVLGAGVVGARGLVGDRPGRRDAVEVPERFEVPLAEAEQDRPVELGVAAEVVVRPLAWTSEPIGGRPSANGWRRAGDPCHAAPVPKNYFDERIAKTYDAKWAELFEPAVVDPAVSFLADLAGTGAALELGIGTGRIAIPLSQRDVRVHGIDLSPDMVAQLQAKPGTDDIGVTIGDFATTSVGGTFKLAYLVRNTIANRPPKTNRLRAFATSPRIWNPAAASSSRCTSRSYNVSRRARPSTRSP